MSDDGRSGVADSLHAQSGQVSSQSGQFNQVPSGVRRGAGRRCGVRNLAVGVAQAHANHLVHDALEFVPQTVAPSSASRQARADALSTNGITNVNDALALLADGEDTALPIRRKGTEYRSRVHLGKRNLRDLREKLRGESTETLCVHRT